MIKANHIAFSSGKKTILRPMSMTFDKPEMIVILGPNGAGKSTLLQILAGLFKPVSGQISYAEKPLDSWETGELAKKRSYLHQHNNVFGAFTVEDILEMGRYPYFDMKPTAKDRLLVEQVIAEMGLQSRRQQVYQTLSGGEQQRIQFSRAILQLQDPEKENLENKVLFLDEPLNNLDLHYQYSLMGQARNKIVDKGGIVIAVLHDINMAYQFADRILILKDGNLVVDDVTEKALDPEVLGNIFDIDVKKITISPNEVFFSTKPTYRTAAGGNTSKFEFTNPVSGQTEI